MSTDIHATAVVEPGAELGVGVQVGPYCVVGPHVQVGDDCVLRAHAVVDGRTELGPGCTVYPFASVGTQTQDLKFAGGATYVRVGARTVVREYVTINSGTAEGDETLVGEDCLLMASAHVAHQCVVGSNVIIANCGTLAGHVVVEDHAIVGGLSAVHQFVRIGRHCIIGGCSKVTRDCPPYMTIDGHPARVRGVNSVGLRRRGFDADAMRALKRAYRILFREGLAVRNAVARVRETLSATEEVEHLLAFIEASERGIAQ